MKKVSIIVPVHNSEKYIEACIDSILNQTYQCFELILIDDNSTDSSADILKKYQTLDDRIMVKHVCAGSAGKARNYGLKEASGFYLAFIDSDDWVEATYLEDLIMELEKNDCDCAMCGVVLQFINGTTKTRIMQASKNVMNGKDMRNGTLISIMPKSCYAPTFYLWDKVYKRSLWEGVTFDEELRNAEDRVALYKVFNDNVRTAITQKLLYNYRMGVGLTSQKDSFTKHDDYLAGYKMLEIAKEKQYDLAPVYETIVCHTLGKARKLIREGGYTHYCTLACEYKKIYPSCKDVIRVASAKYKISSRLLRYFPRLMYYVYRLLGKAKAAFYNTLPMKG